MRSSGTQRWRGFSVTHASPVASVGPLTRLLDRRIPQCDDSNRIRPGEICSGRRGRSVRLVYPEVEIARDVVPAISQPSGEFARTGSFESSRSPLRR
jgi:hypothetical protein